MPRSLSFSLQQGAVRALQTSSSNSATPLTIPAVPAPPPKAPLPSATLPQERVARKRNQAEYLRIAQNLRGNPDGSNPLKKRFWKEVSVKELDGGYRLKRYGHFKHTHSPPDGLQVMLDTRPVRTASRAILTLPKDKPALATAIAIEWDMLLNAQQAVRQHYIPLTSLASRALDIADADKTSNTSLREGIIKMAMRYLDTDTLLCWAPEHNLHDNVGLDMHKEGDERAVSLRKVQEQTAKPILAHLTTHVWPGVEFVPILGEDTIMPEPQPDLTKQVIHGWLTGLPPFELAALERGVLASKSLLISARLLVDWSTEFGARNDTRKFTINDAAQACNLEVAWQTGMWGEVEDTHDVDHEDMKRQLGSVVLLVSGSDK